MITHLQSVLNSAEFKVIPPSISDVNEAIKHLIPKGFEGFIQSFTDGFDIHLELLDEKVYNRKIEIKSRMFDLETHGLFFPKFMYTDLKNKTFTLNHNQVLHLILLHRFHQLKPMERPFLNLITKDIDRLNRYIRYSIPESYNDKIKVTNGTVVIYYPKFSNLVSDFPSSTFANLMDEAKWKTFLGHNNLALSSVGSMSKSNTVVLKQNGVQTYRAPAYYETDEGFYSIFKSGQNVPARFQSHVINSAYKLKNYSNSIIQQDNLLADGKLMVKDKTLRESIVVFHPFEGDRFIAGEGEASREFAKTLVEVSVNIEDCFSSLNVVEGQTYTIPKGQKDFVLGVNLLDEEVVISDFKELTVKSIKITGINGSVRLNISGIKEAGNARVVSNTGCKSVTKVVPNLGKIIFEEAPVIISKEDTCSLAQGLEESIASYMKGERKDNEEDPLLHIKRKYPELDLDSLVDYPKVDDEPKEVGEGFIVNPDILLGMNSVKGKSNGIVLAQACLAVKLGYYTPKEKFGFKGLLDSLNEQEINEAAQSLPKFKYIDRFGNKVDVHVGLVYLQFTEMCATYTRMKDQSFSFESGRVLATDNETSKALFHHIWDNYLEQDKIEASKELFKIYLTCSTGVFNNDDHLPIYNLDDINKLFTRKDLVLTTVNQFPSDSILLDEEWNKGFFIDLSKYKGAPCIRIPSAKTLSMFSGVLKNGDTIYHTNLINVSKIIDGCLRTDDGGYKLNTVYARDKNRDTPALAFNRYTANIQSTLYSSEDESQRLVQSFIKPKIPGINFKQLSEALLPDNTVLLCDDKVYNRIKRESLKGADKSLTENELMLLLNTQKLNETDDVKLQKEIFKELNEECPLALVIRSPSLWNSQVLKVRVWDKTMFELYLKLYKGINIKDVLDTYYNRDVLLCAYNLLVISHGDSDGDLLPMMTFRHEGQKLLKDFHLEKITQAEYDWHKEYKEKEMSSGPELYEEHRYKLYFVKYKDYNKYISNAIVCKALTGTSTLGIWTWSALLSTYKAYWEENRGVYRKKDRNIPLTPISDKDIARLEFEFSRLTQELVINGIKHVQNGSADFQPYALNNIGEKKYEKTVRHQLFTKYHVPNELIDKLFFIVRFAQDNNDMMKACQNFFSLYNKGRFPADSKALDYWESYIVNNTHFGSQLKDLFSIKQQFENKTASDEEFILNLLNGTSLEELPETKKEIQISNSNVVIDYQL